MILARQRNPRGQTYLRRRTDALFNPLGTVSICIIDHFQCAQVCKSLSVVYSRTMAMKRTHMSRNRVSKGSNRLDEWC